MSDFGEIITIAIFILISLFSSIMNKKKKAAEKAKRDREDISDEIPVEDIDNQNQPKNPFEIFTQKLENKVSEVDAYFAELENKIVKEEQPKVAELKTNVTSKFVPLEKTKIEVPHFEKAAVVKRQFSTKNRRVTELQRKFKNPNTVKELIIANEILNKPKALL